MAAAASYGKTCCFLFQLISLDLDKENFTKSDYVICQTNQTIIISKMLIKLNKVLLQDMSIKFAFDFQCSKRKGGTKTHDLH